MFEMTWLIIGAIGGSLLVRFAHGRHIGGCRKLMGRSLVIAALVYVVFALIAWDMQWFMIELLGVPIYGFFYWISTKKTIYWIGIGWLFHPVWDVFLHLYGPGHGVAPEWYAIACLSFDFIVGGYLLWRYKKGV